MAAKLRCNCIWKRECNLRCKPYECSDYDTFEHKLDDIRAEQIHRERENGEIDS